MPELPCRVKPITQISAGQAGEHVNRDFEQLFPAVNQLIRCVTKLSSFANSVSNGSFGSGENTSTGGSPGPGGVEVVVPQGPGSPNQLIYSSGSNVILPEG